MNRKQKRKNNKGFSLVELIIVIAIMAILAGILAPQFVKYVNRGKVSTDIQNAQQIASAIAVYYADNAGTAKDENFVAVKEGAALTDGTKVEDLLNGLPTVKAENGMFAFSIQDGKVTVAVVDTTATSMPASDSDHILYPNQPTTGTWASK